MFSEIDKPIRKTRALLRNTKEMLPFLPDYIRCHAMGYGNAFKIFTHLTVQERLTLYRLARQQPIGSVLCEIGSYLGASSCFLAAGAVEIKGKLHCVDTWANEGMSEGVRDTWMDFQRNTERYRHVIVSHKNRSSEIAKNFTEKINLLFIDGDHSYDGCRLDVESWFPLLNAGGLVIFHDYGWAEGVQKVVHEFIIPRAIKEGKLPNIYWAWIK